MAERDVPSEPTPEDRARLHALAAGFAEVRAQLDRWGPDELVPLPNRQWRTLIDGLDRAVMWGELASLEVVHLRAEVAAERADRERLRAALHNVLAILDAEQTRTYGPTAVSLHHLESRVRAALREAAP